MLILIYVPRINIRMNSGELKALVKVWADRIGHKEAFKRLVAVDISGPMATKLLAGTYEPTPSLDKAMAIIEELKRDGLVKAS